MEPMYVGWDRGEYVATFFKRPADKASVIGYGADFWDKFVEQNPTKGL